MGKLLVISLLVIALFLGACVQAQNPPTPPSPPPSTPPAGNQSGTGAGAGTASVTIKNFAFSPSNLTVKKGATVTWTNEDSAPHKIASDLTGFGSDALSQGATYQFTFVQTGTFGYHCSIHPSMKGTITVEE